MDIVIEEEGDKFNRPLDSLQGGIMIAQGAG
jgi:hypothetical protein